MSLRFGTDGVRGDAETELTRELVLALGRAAALVLPGERWLIGRDTRASGPRIGRDLGAGLALEGREVELLGVLPTPGIAFLSTVEDRPAAVISASHNPWTDNGIKFFAPGGRKLTDEIEERLEAELDRLLDGSDASGSIDDAPVDDGPEAEADVHRYRDWLVGSLDGRGLDGLRVVLDCANGAASGLAPEVFGMLGATVEVFHDQPDGRNINAGCGSTDPSALVQRMRQGGADIGLAFDGDADRVIAVDEHGNIIDGDHIIAMCAIDRRDRGLLPNDTVVITVMSNLGLRRGLAATGIEVIETPVGDRYVLEALDQHGLMLGGEQSGHIIFRDLATTGDGVLTGLQVADLLMRSGRFLSDWAQTSMRSYPQVLRNVKVKSRDGGLVDRLAGDIAAVEAELADDGRVLVRPSGTEPVVRVMVEAPSTLLAEAMADRLVAAVQRAAG